MIGILIITHENLGESLIRCATHIMGEEQQRLRCLNVFIQDNPDAVVVHARNLIQQLDSGDGVLVFSDMVGATPYNIACQLIIPGKVAGLAGVNLPMLVRSLTYRAQPLALVIEKSCIGGKEGITLIHSDCNHAK